MNGVVFISGLLTAGYAVASLFFLRFWRESRDRLFAFFSAAFLLLALQRVMLIVLAGHESVYTVRLLAFVLILAAIIDKNRGG